MKKLNDIFKSVAEVALPSHSYSFERWSNAAEKIHSQSLPAVIHIVPRSIDVELNAFQTKAKSTVTCLLAFFDLCPSLDASGEETVIVVDRCKEDARKFLAELIRRDGVEIIGNVRMEVTEARFAAALAGIVMEVKVTTNAESLCEI